MSTDYSKLIARLTAFARTIADNDTLTKYGCFVSEARDIEAMADALTRLSQRVQQQALEYVSLQAQCSEHLARIAELEQKHKEAWDDCSELNTANHELLAACGEKDKRIADLEKECAALIHDNASLLQIATAEANTANEVIAERDALKVDAMRYRWLRDKANATHAWAPMVFHCNPHCSIEWTNALCGEKLDVNVDAALQAEKETRS